VFSALTGRREHEDFSWLACYVPGLETRNGQMRHAANAGAARLAEQLGKIAVGGSDSHTLRGVGRTYTEVPGVRTVDEFLGGLRTGCAQVHGRSGSYLGLTADVFSILKELLREKPWTAAFLPLSLLVPAFVMGHWMNEARFCRRWVAACESLERQPRLWEADSSFEAIFAGS